MADRSTWRDAFEAADRLKPIDDELLPLLAQLPYAPVDLLAQLAAISRGYACERLATLGTAGLVTSIAAPSRGGCPARLYRLADLGVAVLALAQQTAVDDLVRRYRLSDVLALPLQLPHLMAVYRLLAVVAGAWPDPKQLLAWQRPWRRRFLVAGNTFPTSVMVPAYAALGSTGGPSGSYLFLPDQAGVPLAAYRGTIVALLRLGAAEERRLPLPVVATTTAGRSHAWRKLLEEVSSALGEGPLASCIQTWDGLAGALAKAPLVPAPETSATDGVRRPTRAALSVALQPRRRLPELSAGRSSRGDDEANTGALAVSIDHVELLDLVGRYPLLTVTQIARLRSCSAAVVH